MFLYDNSKSNFQFKFYIFDRLIAGLDGISLWLILLVNLIIPIVIFNSINLRYDKYKTTQFLFFIFFIQFFSILVFIVLDLLLFYIAFESILIPMFFLIGYYGSRNKKLEANYLFFLYTLFGSLFLLFSIIALALQTGSTDYETILIFPISINQQYVLWLGFFLALAIKMPMLPFHIWLPQAHTEAPTEGSVILAAILLKLGTYGFLRFSIPLFPDATLFFSPFVSILAIIGVLYSCISAISLIDFKQIIAYSSIAHMNVSVIGLFSNDFNGLSGCFLYTIAHGFVSAGLFLLVGFLYSRYHTRTLKYYRGLVLILPLYVFSFFLFVLANLSFPGSLGFIAEMFIYFSCLSLSPFILLFISLVSIFLPVYFIWTFQKLSFGSLSTHFSLLKSDLTFRELNLLFPLFFLTFFLGFFPSILSDSIELPLSCLLF